MVAVLIVVAILEAIAGVTIVRMWRRAQRYEDDAAENFVAVLDMRARVERELAGIELIKKRCSA